MIVRKGWNEQEGEEEDGDLRQPHRRMLEYRKKSLKIVNGIDQRPGVCLNGHAAVMACSQEDKHHVLCGLLPLCVGLLVHGCLTSRQHEDVSHGRICSDNYAYCHIHIEVAYHIRPGRAGWPLGCQFLGHCDVSIRKRPTAKIESSSVN